MKKQEVLSHRGSPYVGAPHAHGCKIRHETRAGKPSARTQSATSRAFFYACDASTCSGRGSQTESALYVESCASPAERSWRAVAILSALRYWSLAV